MTQFIFIATSIEMCVCVGDYKSLDQCEMIAKATEEIAAGGLEDGNRIFPFSSEFVWEGVYDDDVAEERERWSMKSKWNLLAEED